MTVPGELIARDGSIEAAAIAVRDDTSYSASNLTVSRRYCTLLVESLGTLTSDFSMTSFLGH